VFLRWPALHRTALPRLSPLGPRRADSPRTAPSTSNCAALRRTAPSTRLALCCLALSPQRDPPHTLDTARLALPRALGSHRLAAPAVAPHLPRDPARLTSPRSSCHCLRQGSHMTHCAESCATATNISFHSLRPTLPTPPSLSTPTFQVPAVPRCSALLCFFIPAGLPVQAGRAAGRNAFVWMLGTYD
jgi:hypothetical protein